MIETERHDDALDTLLRASKPAPVVDDGFVARAMTAVDRAARSLPAPRRPAPIAPLVLARALAAERHRQARRARLWRWASAGAIGGYVLMLVAMATSPAGMTTDMPTPWNLTPLALLACLGAVWIAWRELRAN